MSLPKVLVVNPIVPQSALSLLKGKCYVSISPAHTKEAVLPLLKGVDAVLWSGRLKLDKELLDVAGSQLKIVATSSSGYNHIDLGELKRRGIKLSNSTAHNTVADTALLLALGAARRFTEGRWHIERGTWPHEFSIDWMLGRDISGATIGLIGFGGIGQAIAARTRAFQAARILYTGHKEKPEAHQLGAYFVPLNTLIQDSDFIFLAVPLTKETRHMCNSAFFERMKNTAVLVNVGRGDLVDQEALIKALREGQIFAAGLDVMTPEPLNTDCELLTLPNVVLTPHIGSATRKTREEMSELAARNILRGLAGEPLLTPVEL
ncbi:glyoxylate reductase/hydroxypyruvate reductase-like [Euwallacea fornicatus]|uniref:glyoxylate reductase/hydroxypyruvate reductase-like n=1 Tax=Euwallacea fornicatus TaxID=995702 RepID=UPI0033903E93